MKVLLVDDDPDVSELFKLIGKYENVETEIFTSGLDALKYLEDTTEKVDVVILDLSLPVLDGLTIAEEIRRNEDIHPDRRAVRMVFFTGYDIDETIKRIGERVGVEKIYKKPYDLRKMMCEVKNWFGE